ncbi:uncharacterized protein LOC126883686 [Diabrotica virgifera virgifera]|uniref:CCHC-type domain-containing protein n=1 Tax=Diabrotica virgifera virgifera TaxID=50390 RepID=A0ABM5K537_DIAVI|nr:uncharacterized protein LOC126883686 [Diabrotica virgifera virgifera]
MPVSEGESKRISKPPPRMTYNEFGNPIDASTPVRVRQPIVNLNRRSSLSRASSVYSTSKEQEKVEQYSEDFSTLKEISPENLSVDEAEKPVNVQKNLQESKKTLRHLQLKLQGLQSLSLVHERKLKNLEELKKKKDEAIRQSIAEDQYLGFDDDGEVVETNHSNEMNMQTEVEEIPQVKCLPESKNLPVDPIVLMTQAISQMSATPSYSRKHEELPKFNGCSEEWPLFKAEFDRSTKEYKIDNSINIRRLREALKGDALETVSFLLPNIDNVESIMKTLEDRFGQPKFVIEGLLKKARAVPSPSVTKPEATIKFGIAVQPVVASITSYKSSQYLYSIEILSTLVKKMSIEMETEWYSWLRQDTSREENLKYFSQWISIKQSLAYLESTPTISSENANDKDRKKKQTHFGKVSTNPNPDRKEYCVYCKIENHHVSDCRKFSALPIKEKDEFAKKNLMCFRCLKKNHAVKNCKSRMTCKIEGCRGRHHTSLHNNSRFNEVQRKVI